MAEGAPLLREYVGKTCIKGSNPFDSARQLRKRAPRGPFSFRCLSMPKGPGQPGRVGNGIDRAGTAP